MTRLVQGWIFVAVVAVIALALALWTGLGGRRDARPLPDHVSSPQWQQALALANQGLPRMVDEFARLDRVSEGPGPVVIYHYTLTNYPVEGRNPREIHHELDQFESHLRTHACKSASTRIFLGQGATVHFHYSDKHAHRLFDVHVHPYECRP
ncbi:hypothetical protein [Lysobacter enzymogenes]|uniref:hypothetical protein n=1 Tax=Lysobacter enzymogenes TaxID=69 RepID=UPI000F4C50A1|nr:hypothetical protein [Lysobacter enzymogenes]